MYPGELDRAGDERNVAEVLRNALREADARAGYALDAGEAGNERLAEFFREVQETHATAAGRAEEMLGGRGGEERAGVVGQGSVPAEGDPGGVSPGQDRVA
jgi:hypothetical protein